MIYDCILYRIEKIRVNKSMLVGTSVYVCLTTSHMYTYKYIYDLCGVYTQIERRHACLTHKSTEIQRGCMRLVSGIVCSFVAGSREARRRAWGEGVVVAGCQGRYIHTWWVTMTTSFLRDQLINSRLLGVGTLTRDFNHQSVLFHLYKQVFLFLYAIFIHLFARLTGVIVVEVVAVLAEVVTVLVVSISSNNSNSSSSSTNANVCTCIHSYYCCEIIIQKTMMIYLLNQQK